MEQEKRQIPIKVRNKRAELVNPNEEPLVCGNNDYQIVFDFDEDWENYPVKTAMFVYGKDNSVSVVFNGNVCDGVEIKDSTMVAIGVFAGDIRTSTGATLCCVLSIRDLGKTPKAPTPDVYNQIMELLQKAIQAHTELPVGGFKGQVLKKRSAEDYDTEWADDEGRKSEWDFVIDDYSKLGKISQMYGNVLIQCEIPSESGDVISVPKAVKYLKIDIPYTSDWLLGAVTGHGGCVLEGTGHLGYDCEISGFKEVRNVVVSNATIKYCNFVYNCTALNFEHCDYIELASFAETGSNWGVSGTIKNCKHVCHVNYGKPNDTFIISACDIVENISLFGEAFASSVITITSAKTVDMVSGFASATYENCKYVNPQTCQDYVVQQNAVGKVQVLTADGSFEAAELGSSGGVDENINQRVTDLENAVYGVEEELQMLNEGGIE